MNKKELIERMEGYENLFGNKVEYIEIDAAIELISKLNEPQKPVIPQFVAEIIEYYKRNNATLYDALGEKNFNKQYSEWLLNEQNAYDKVARAWLDGYEVEKEKRYTVKMKGVHPGSVYLKRQTEDDYWYFGVNSENKCIAIKHTRKELEEANFGWVFDCPGIEIEEVEE